MHVGGGISAKALLQTIQNIVTDNERLHKDQEEKAAQLAKARQQVSDLLDKNQVSSPSLLSRSPFFIPFLLLSPPYSSPLLLSFLSFTPSYL